MSKLIFSIVLLLSLRSVATTPTPSPDPQQEMLKRFQEIKKRLLDSMTSDDVNSNGFMDDFFNDSNSLMKDLDENLFKSLGVGANLTGDLFRGRWQEEKEGRAFFVTPKEKAELKLEVKDALIHLESKESSTNAVSSSKITLSVPDELDWRKHKISKKGNDIMIFFPYHAGARQERIKVKSNDPDQKIPVVPKDSTDII